MLLNYETLKPQFQIRVVAVSFRAVDPCIEIIRFGGIFTSLYEYCR
jgi:hypothetical protein